MEEVRRLMSLVRLKRIEQEIKALTRQKGSRSCHVCFRWPRMMISPVPPEDRTDPPWPNGRCPGCGASKVTWLILPDAVWEAV